MRRLWRVVAVLTAGVALASCTFVPTDAHPQVVNPHSVPFDLLAKKPAAPSP